MFSLPKHAQSSLQDESFGLVSSALLGGAPLVLGAQWDVLGGDLDKLASRQGDAETTCLKHFSAGALDVLFVRRLFHVEFVPAENPFAV